MEKTAIDYSAQARTNPVFMTAKTAICLMVFSLIYTPCVAAIASIRREMGHKWAIGVVLWQCAVAWVVTLIVHLIAKLF